MKGKIMQISRHTQVQIGNTNWQHKGKISWGTVKTFQNENIVRKMMNEYAMSREDALELFEDTKRFLFLCASQPTRLAPTAQLDRGWHTFILFTREYAEFCDRYLGGFIHHAPTVRYEGTTAVHSGAPHNVLVDIAKLEFGDTLSANWQMAVKDCNASGSCCNGGNCSNSGACSHCTSE